MANVTFTFNTRDMGEKIRSELQKQPEKTKRIMNAIGGFLNGEAKKRAPVDEGFLTADISNKTVENQKSFAAVVYVPLNATSAPYAIAMHENQYMLGENSMAKAKKVPVHVGRRFITRALLENNVNLRKIIQKELEI